MTDLTRQQAELDKIEATLRSLASLLSGEALAAAQKPLLERKAALLVGSGVIVQGNQNKVVGPGGILIEGSIYLGPPPKNPEEALAIYRRVVAETTACLPLRGVDVGASDAAAAQKPVGLSNVYIALDTRTQIEANQGKSKKAKGERDSQLQERQTRPLTALEAVMANRHLVLLGEPGGGKSTFVNFLAHCLAAQAFEFLTGWPEAERKALPVVILLRDFARRLLKKLPERAEPRHLWDFIAERLKEQNLKDAARPVQQALEAGNACILLDGLDEIPTPDQRRFVRDAVRAFAGRYPKSRFLITCRVLSYQPPERGKPDLRLSELPEFSIAPFDKEKIDRFISAWYIELARLGTVPTADVDGLTARLRQAVRRPDLQRLALNPLLLTVMALVHTHKGRLPDARAQLYEDTVDILLWRWEQIKAGGQEDAPRLRQLLLDAGRSDVDLKRVLWSLAYEAHSQVGADRDGEKLADIGELKLQKALAALRRNSSLDWAAQVIEVMKLRAGLLLERLPSVFTFPHRTFQEYLAGAHLATQANFAALGNELARQGALWREVILLAAGKLVYLHGDLDKPLALVGELCPSKIVEADDLPWRKTWLAGDLLLEIGLQRVCDTNLGCDLLERVRLRLADLIRLGMLAPVERARAGDTLAKLGDPRSEVMACEQMAFCHVPGGDFLFGDEKKEKTRLDEFWIGKYPVTNAQYAEFVAAQGYQNPTYWQEAIEAKYWTKRGFKGRFDNEPRFAPFDCGEPFTLTNHPVVGISWYEALAFCRWLTEKLKGLGEKGGGDKVMLAGLASGKLMATLPNETEWEKAARGPLTPAPLPTLGEGLGVRDYPWGSDFDPNKANTEETGIGATTTVGSFPGGQSPFGLLDASGNVWEWTMSGDSNARVLRGGSFVDVARNARVSYRDWYSPDFRLRHHGFRVALAPFR